MSTLWLHIGHDKTGSSYLQHLLARGRGVLRAHGIAYPMGRGAAGLARAGVVLHGNGGRMTRRPASDGDALFSHEGIFTALATDFDSTLAQIRQAARARGVMRIKMLLFVRDPVDHAGSLYQQEVRHCGLAYGPDAYFTRYQRPRIVWQVVQRLAACPDIHLRIENYSHIKTHLADTLTDWLGLPRGGLGTHGTRLFNRGCTHAELGALRRLNAAAPRLTPWAARSMRLLRPRARAVPVAAGYGAQEQVWHNNADAMALLNRHHLPAKTPYRMIYRAPSDMP